MTAAVKIHELTASQEGVDKTDGIVRFKNANSTLVDNDDRLQVPTSGTNYSFTKQLRMYVATAPSVDLQNLQAYSDGAGFRASIGVQYDTLTATSFAANASTDISGTDLFTRGPATKIDMDAGLASTEFLGTGYKGLMLRLQMSIAPSAEAGSLAASAETLSMSYDET